MRASGFRGRPVKSALRRNRKPEQTETSQPHWADVWLPRLSHLAQFGLFVFTLGSLYFTVLPLYQKALLDEAIAKKELELKAATASLENKYVRIRGFAVKEYVMYAGAECTALLKRPVALPAPGEKAVRIPPRAEDVYSIDIKECLLKSADAAPSLKELTAEDQTHLRTTLTQMGDRLGKARETSLVQYRAIPENITEAQVAALSASSARARALEFLARMYPPEQLRPRRRALAVEIEQERVGKQYEDQIMREIYSLRTLSWPRARDAL